MLAEKKKKIIKGCVCISICLALAAIITGITLAAIACSDGYSKVSRFIFQCGR